MNQTLLPRSLFYIIIGAFIIRVLLLSTIISHFGESGTFLPDSKGFYRTAVNLTEGHGFSRETEAPYKPSAYFPPLYPLLLAGSLKISGSLLPALIIQIILASLIPLLIWKIGNYFTRKPAPLLIASGLAAFEPITILWSIVVLTEVLSVFFLLWAVYFFLKFFDQKRILHIILSATMLGLSTLTRPHGQYLFFLTALCLVIFGIIQWYRNSQKTLIFSGAVFIFVFYLVLSLWLIRNYTQFGSTNVSTTGLRNLYVTLAPSILSVKTGRHYDVEKTELLQKFAKKHNIPSSQISENPSFGKKLAKEGLKIMFENPVPTLKVFLIDINAFFTQDLYLTYAKRFNITPHIPFDFSPSLVLIQEGPIKLAKLVWKRVGGYVVIPLTGRLLWILLTLLATVGAYLGVREQEKRSVALIFIIIILYYLASSIPDGFGDLGRHRYPANAFIFLLASYGLISLKEQWDRKKIG